MTIKLNNGKGFELARGDITRFAAEAIVNAANSSLMGGGGVDGAIHAAGGPEILAACKEIIQTIGSLPAGQAVITTGGRLAAKQVIHTVGPVWRGGTHHEDELLESAYRECMLAAEKNGLRSIAFPSISTGAFSFPLMRAAKIAVTTVIACLKENPVVTRAAFVLFDARTMAAYKTALTESPGWKP